MKTETKNVFAKLHKARTQCKGVALGFADVELLCDVLGDEIAKAEAEYEQWRERFTEYERNRSREGDKADG